MKFVRLDSENVPVKEDWCGHCCRWMTDKKYEMNSNLEKVIGLERCPLWCQQQLQMSNLVGAPALIFLMENMVVFFIIKYLFKWEIKTIGNRSYSICLLVSKYSVQNPMK